MKEMSMFVFEGGTQACEHFAREALITFVTTVQLHT